MGIHIPEEIIKKQAITASLQFSIDHVKDQVRTELGKLGIFDEIIIRNSELLTLAFTHTEALENTLGTGLQVDKIRRIIYGDCDNSFFEINDSDGLKKYLQNHSDSGVYVGDTKLYVQDVNGKELDEILRKIILPKYIGEKLHG